MTVLKHRYRLVDGKRKRFLVIPVSRNKDEPYQGIRFSLEIPADTPKAVIEKLQREAKGEVS